MLQAELTPVWVVWWEDPERSWESVCLSEEEADREFAARSADSLLASWGKVGRRDRQSLAAWIGGHVAVARDRAEEFRAHANEILRRVSAGESGPVTIRTW